MLSIKSSNNTKCVCCYTHFAINIAKKLCISRRLALVYGRALTKKEFTVLFKTLFKLFDVEQIYHLLYFTCWLSFCIVIRAIPDCPRTCGCRREISKFVYDIFFLNFRISSRTAVDCSISCSWPH